MSDKIIKGYLIVNLAPVSQRLDNFIQWISHYPEYFFFIFIYLFFLTALLAIYSVTIVINEKLHVHNYEGKK